MPACTPWQLIQGSANSGTGKPPGPQGAPVLRPSALQAEGPTTPDTHTHTHTDTLTYTYFVVDAEVDRPWAEFSNVSNI